MSLEAISSTAPAAPGRDPFEGARELQLSSHERAIVVAIAEACMPANTFLEGGGQGTLERLLRFSRGMSSDFLGSLRALLWLVEGASVPFTGRPFTMLARD